MLQGWRGGKTQSAEESIALGKEFSSFIQQGDIISLKGDLASGKTTFTKGILTGLGFSGDVTSPTFTLVNEYASKIPVIHIDCYRESNQKRWQNLGLNEYLYSDNIVLIEWAEIIEDILPDDLIVINFTNLGGNEREIRCLV
jgi:tRNA threonylcarbamoyladenosine biosynthesis protein TsaE